MRPSSLSSAKAALSVQVPVVPPMAKAPCTRSCTRTVLLPLTVRSPNTSEPANTLLLPLINTSPVTFTNSSQAVLGHGQVAVDGQPPQPHVVAVEDHAFDGSAVGGVVEGHGGVVLVLGHGNVAVAIDHGGLAVVGGRVADDVDHLALDDNDVVRSTVALAEGAGGLGGQAVVADDDAVIAGQRVGGAPDGGAVAVGADDAGAVFAVVGLDVAGGGQAALVAGCGEGGDAGEGDGVAGHGVVVWVVCLCRRMWAGGGGRCEAV